MIEQVFLLSFTITGLHIAFSPGNILSFARVWVANQLDRLIGKKWSTYVQKPLWACLPCMGSLWTILLSGFNPLLICAVVGFNVIIARAIEPDEVVLTELKSSAGETEYHDDIPTISRQIKANG